MSEFSEIVKRLIAELEVEINRLIAAEVERQLNARPPLPEVNPPIEEVSERRVRLSRVLPPQQRRISFKDNYNSDFFNFFDDE
ncbi:hypothetical protein GEMRC1_000128 [Eukaryota sp. GEM-RC1]